MATSVSDPRQTETAKLKRFQRFRLALLIGLMAVEIILIVSLRQRGWVATTESTSWILTGFAAFLPLVVAAVLLFTSGRRMKLRTLFLFVGAICVFLSVSLTPLISVRRSRVAARELLELGAELRPVSYGDYTYDDPDPTPMSNVRFSPADDIPSWLRPLSRDWESIPRDSEVAWVILRDDDQVDAFVRRVSNLENVRCLDMVNGVTDESIRKLAALHNQLPNLNTLRVSATSTTANSIRELGKFSSIRWLEFSGVAIPQEGWFESFPELRVLFVGDEKQIAYPDDVSCELSQYNVDAISKLPELVDVTFLGLNMKGINLSSFENLKKLILLRLNCRNLDHAQIQELQKKSPKVRLWINGNPPGYISGAAN